MVLATGLALLYYVRATYRVLFGPGPAPAMGAAVSGAPHLAASVLAGLAGLVLLPGLWPGLVTGWLL